MFSCPTCGSGFSRFGPTTRAFLACLLGHRPQLSIETIGGNNKALHNSLGMSNNLQVEKSRKIETNYWTNKAISTNNHDDRNNIKYSYGPPPASGGCMEHRTGNKSTNLFGCSLRRKSSPVHFPSGEINT